MNNTLNKYERDYAIRAKRSTEAETQIEISPRIGALFQDSLPCRVSEIRWPIRYERLQEDGNGKANRYKWFNFKSYLSALAQDISENSIIIARVYHFCIFAALK